VIWKSTSICEVRYVLHSCIKCLINPLLSVVEYYLAPAELDDAGGDDDEEGDELAVGEHVLDEGGPLHLPAVHKRQDACIIIYVTNVQTGGTRVYGKRKRNIHRFCYVMSQDKKKDCTAQYT
jgi:hypothetical protein